MRPLILAVLLTLLPTAAEAMDPADALSAGRVAWRETRQLGSAALARLRLLAHGAMAPAASALVLLPPIGKTLVASISLSPYRKAAPVPAMPLHSEPVVVLDRGELPRPGVLAVLPLLTF